MPKLIETSDLTGTFHCHTDWSDGTNTLEEMAEAARALGLHYLGIADHSKSAGYAGGLSIDRVREQWAEIDALNKKMARRFASSKGPSATSWSTARWTIPMKFSTDSTMS